MSEVSPKEHRGISCGIFCTDDDCWCQDPAQNHRHPSHSSLHASADANPITAAEAGASTAVALSSKTSVSAVEAFKVLVEEIDATGVFLDGPKDAVKFVAQCVSSALTKLIQRESSPDEPQPAASNERAQGPLWIPTAQVERMMRECRENPFDTVGVDRKTLEGLLHDSLLWRQERAARQIRHPETNGAGLRVILAEGRELAATLRARGIEGFSVVTDLCDILEGRTSSRPDMATAAPAGLSPEKASAEWYCPCGAPLESKDADCTRCQPVKTTCGRTAGPTEAVCSLPSGHAGDHDYRVPESEDCSNG